MEELSGVFITADIPDTLVTPTAPGQAPTSPAALCSQVEERGALEGAAFGQRPQLLLSLMPKLKE